jgi:hypothetical protein
MKPARNGKAANPKTASGENRILESVARTIGSALGAVTAKSHALSEEARRLINRGTSSATSSRAGRGSRKRAANSKGVARKRRSEAKAKKPTAPAGL